MSCCCTNDGEGHRCTHAWSLIILARSAKLARNKPQLDEARADYTTHLFTAGVIRYGISAWPDTCTETMANDPRCSQCKETR